MDTVFTVESALEFDACFHLEYSHDITSYEAQPEGFIYEFNGRPCPYTPDFKINHSVNGSQFLEIKPVEKISDPNFIERFKAKKLKLQKWDIFNSCYRKSDPHPLFEIASRSRGNSHRSR